MQDRHGQLYSILSGAAPAVSRSGYNSRGSWVGQTVAARIAGRFRPTVRMGGEESPGSKGRGGG
jgi:hypothetical protein